MSEIRSGDLRLTVSQQSTFSIAPYERFLEQLTIGGGPQQREALEVATRYLLGGRYTTLADLADENWTTNPALHAGYRNRRETFMEAQQLRALLAASIDHATGTGKSYMIFGAAAIALASGQVDRVLVLCPSNTIEEGLTKKFRELAETQQLMNLLPKNAVVRRPAIVNAYEGTVPVGAICIENIHAAYESSMSSIRDSFAGAGERTLVINDEAHHIYTIERGSGPKKIKEWLAFLLDPAFGFRRVLNFSGTCFIGDDYFPDVIHRFSLQEALDAHRIKDVHYWVTGQDFASPAERWSAALKNHQDNEALYAGIKPITIFVTDKVDKAKEIHAEFTAFLADTLKISEAAAAKRTLVVSSHKEHLPNLAILRTVDKATNPVEFIFSVSMLTEGWDVKNVLQIVPHEKRAFDSKLLISQVLGRGLRLLPDPYRDAKVTVFNHARWAPEMSRLFHDVWEGHERVDSSPIVGSPYHFELSLLDVDRGPAPVQNTGSPKGRAAGETLSLSPQRARETVGSLVDMAGKSEERRYKYTEPVTPVDDLLADISEKTSAKALETGDWSADDTKGLREEIVKALRAAREPNDLVSDTNKAKILAWLRPPVVGRRMSLTTTSERLVPRSTKDLVVRSASRAELARHTTIALRTDNGRAIRWPGHDTGQYDLLDEVLDDRTVPRGAVIEVTDQLRWRTPVDLVIVSHEPERGFLRELLARGEAAGVHAWVKSPDSGFYSVPYAITRNGNTRNLGFNPDWFIAVGDDILVVETKMNEDTKDENRAKIKSATEYFAKVNELRAGKPGRYYFYLLSPSDYTAFFDDAAAGKYPDFLPTLQAELT